MGPAGLAVERSETFEHRQVRDNQRPSCRCPFRGPPPFGTRKGNQERLRRLARERVIGPVFSQSRGACWDVRSANGSDVHVAVFSSPHRVARGSILCDVLRRLDPAEVVLVRIRGRCGARQQDQRSNQGEKRDDMVSSTHRSTSQLERGS